MATDTVNATVSNGLLRRTAIRLQQVVCGLKGHDELLHFEQARISLHCVSCGYQSPGWEVAPGNDRRADAAGAPAPAPRARILRLPLVNHRRVA